MKNKSYPLRSCKLISDLKFRVLKSIYDVYIYISALSNMEDDFSL